jgi:DNA-binding CsgD family transcriptional regulator
MDEDRKAKIKKLRLTPRMLAIAQHASNGMTAQETAQALGTTYKTVGQQRWHLNIRLKTKNITESVAFLLRNGLIE